MKDLIEEIEKLKNRGGWTNDEFYRCGINDCVNLLNQYNIITAPKSIKLSEIVERLKKFDCYKTKCELYREQDKFEIDYYYYSYVKCLSSGYIVIKNNKIETLVADTSTDIHKWLYTLWIAGTEIVDDMKECDDNE